MQSREKILIYGYNGGFKDVVYSLDDEEYEIVGVIDDKPCTLGQKPYGFPFEVTLPEKVGDYEFDRLIISPFWYSDKMKKKVLDELHIPEEKITIWNVSGG